MLRRSLPFVAAGLLAACSLPPYTTPEQSFSVKYAMFVPNIANGIPVPTGLPAFSDKPAPSSTVPVPKEAQRFNIQSLELDLRMSNTGPVPLRIKIFLDKSSVSDTDLYAKQPLGGAQGQIDLPRGGTEVTKQFPIDPSLLKEDTLRLGYTFGSPGTQESVTFKDTDQVNVAYAIKAVVKLF